MTGRDDELARLLDAAGAAASAGARVVAVRGPLGAGKTTLLEQLRARLDGFTVLTARGLAADAELGFASLLTLLRPVEARLDDLAGDLADELRAALALGRRRADPVAVRLAVLRVLAGLAAEAPLLLAVDDADLLDGATADVLAFALARLGADPVLAVVTTEGSRTGPIEALATATVVLEPLPAAVVGEIVDGAAGLAPEPRRRCIDAARGNPLAAIAIAASLDADQRAGRAPLPPVPSAGGVAADAVAERLRRLPEHVRRALVVVAADDSGELAVVTAALDALGEPAGGIDAAESAGLVVVAGTRIDVAHPLVRPVAYHLVGAASRRAAHRALAAALDRPHHAAARAWQLVAAADRPDEAVAASLELVAADAARRGGPASAARTLACAAALSPDPDVADRRRVDAARLWLDAGAPADAARVVAPVAPASGGEALAVRTLASRGHAGLAAAVEAARACPGDPLVAAVLAAELLDAGASDDAVATAGPLAGAAPAGADLLARAVLATAGAAPVDPDALLQLAASSDRRSTAAARARALAATACLDAGHLAAARAIADGPPLALGGPALDLAVVRAAVALAAGDLAGAAATLDRLDALVPPGAGIHRAALDLALADVATLTGRHRDAVELAGSVRDRAAGAGLGRIRDLATAALGRAAVAEGRGDATEPLRLDEDVASAVATADAAGLALRAAELLVLAAERAARDGDRAGAQRALADAERRLAACGVTGWRARLAAVRQAAPDTDPLAERLTPAEQRVALAVGAGRTNQEAAESLFLSAKTVDFHLRAIYRKLGIRSRAELAVLVERGARQRPAEVVA